MNAVYSSWAPSIMISSIMRSCRRLVWRDIRLYVCLIRRSLAGDISDFSGLGYTPRSLSRIQSL